MSDTPAADALAAMSDAELIEAAAGARDSVDVLAAAIARHLDAGTLAIPAHVGEMVKRGAKAGGYQYRQVIPMAGPEGMLTDWRLHPDGSMQLELLDMNSRPFWRGTFRPAETAPRECPCGNPGCHYAR